MLLSYIKGLKNGVMTDLSLSDFVCVDKKLEAGQYSPITFRPRGSNIDQYLETETTAYKLKLIFEIKTTSADLTRTKMSLVANSLYKAEIKFLDDEKVYECIQSEVSYNQLDPRLAYINIDFICEIYSTAQTKVIPGILSTPPSLYYFNSPKIIDISISIAITDNLASNKSFVGWSDLVPDNTFGDTFTLKTVTAGQTVLIDSTKKIFDTTKISLYSFPKAQSAYYIQCNNNLQNYATFTLQYKLRY
jgi:hypothetical protein